eukprot:11226741-Lingulodinium_polyedra.AAC.1
MKLCQSIESAKDDLSWSRMLVTLGECPVQVLNPEHAERDVAVIEDFATVLVARKSLITNSIEREKFKPHSQE